MKSGLFTLFGILTGGLITWGTQYYFRREERRWEERKEKKKVCIECMEILNEILDFYDTFPLDKGDNSFFDKMNEDVRKSLVKLKVLFSNEDTRLIKSFESANLALKGFVTMESGERLKIRKDARVKIKEFENVLIDYFQ